jgi:hypothetical protein
MSSPFDKHRDTLEQLDDAKQLVQSAMEELRASRQA